MQFASWHGKPNRAMRGCSLGNRHTFLRADPRANVDGVWLAQKNHWYTGELSLEPVPSEEWSGEEVGYHLHHQSLHCRHANGGEFTKHIMLDPTHPRVYLWVQGTGFEPETALPFRCRWRVSPSITSGHRQQPDWRDCERRWNLLQHSPECLLARPQSEGLEVLELHASTPFTQTQWHEPNLLLTECSALVEPNGCFELWVCLNLKAVETEYLAPPPHPNIARHDGEHSQESAWQVRVQVSEKCPSEAIRKAVYWGEACTRRVFHKYRNDDRYQGFTNDPPGNTIVTRDVAWFVFGADYFAPDYSRHLLTMLCEHALYTEGKAAEYVRIADDSLSRDDYKLNINDATPLLILGLAHHMRMHKNAPETAKLLPLFADSARRLGDWILQQRSKDGLVCCTGAGTNVWGIASWRNIIPGYRLAGELTELNALCVAALRACANLQSVLGRSMDAERFLRSAETLNAAMIQLVDPETGYFYLTRQDGVPNRQLAVDLAFPALFSAGDEEARHKTLLRLMESDFQCPHGILTLSRNDPAFNPRFGWGLMGGSWPNATAWVASALAQRDREGAWELAERLAQTLVPNENYPQGVSVPGQFPEWFAPDTNESSGMSLSPWMPATFVWLVQEGIPEGGVLI